jgi:hypothetical protein
MWHRHFSSHKQLETTLSSGVPDLGSVHVSELLITSGEQLRFSADVPYPVEGLPERWRAKGLNSVQLRFSLTMAAAPALVGVPLSPTLAKLEFEPGLFRILAHDASWSLQGKAFLDSFEAVGYEKPGPGHAFSWFRPH